MTARQPRPFRLRRWAKLLLAQIAVVILGLLVMEILARGLMRLRNKPYDANATHAEIEHVLDQNRYLVPGPPGVEPAKAGIDVHTQLTLHPYVGYEADAGCSFVDEEYHRLESGETAGEFQILIVGGSVAALFGQHEWKWNSLRDLLAADPRLAGRKIRILNFGRGSYKEPQQLNFVVYLLALGFKPDVVVDIDGFNEVALGNANAANGWNPVFPSFAQWAHLSISGGNTREAVDLVSEICDAQSQLEAWGSRLASWRLDRSCLLGTAALHRMYALRTAVVRRYTAYAKYLGGQGNEAQSRGPRIASGDDQAVKVSVECWKESSISLSAICRARGIVYLQFLQPTLLDDGSKPLSEAEQHHGNCDESWVTGVHMGYPLLRETGKGLRRAGVDFIDTSGLFEGHREDIYYDCCHFGHPGNVLMAQAIAAELSARLPDRK